MTELSLNLLDLFRNSVRAGARNIGLQISRRDGIIRAALTDDGCGMEKETLEGCLDPFFSTRTTRRFGLGLPLTAACCREAGGAFRVKSEEGRGTEISFFLRGDSFDCPPMGDLTGAVQSMAAEEKSDLFFRYEGAHGTVTLDMREVKKALAPVPAGSPAVFQWIGEYLNEGFEEADGAQALNAGEIYFGGAYTMKSVAELEAIRLATLGQVNLRREHADAVHVVIGMGTCGIAAGAKNVLKAFMAEASEKELLKMTVAQTGCMGRCDLEPMVEVACPGQEKVLYTKVKPEMVGRIVAEHVVGGKPVEEYIAK
jgi:NADP-reducing hydrogenase subunit HndB